MATVFSRKAQHGQKRHNISTQTQWPQLIHMFTELPDKELKVLYPAWGNMFSCIKTLHIQVVKT